MVLFHALDNNYVDNNYSKRPVDVISLFLMNIKSYFKVLTEDEVEERDLKARQASRKEIRLSEQVSSQVIDLVEAKFNEPIIIDDEDKIGDIARCAFDDKDRERQTP